MPKSKLSEAIDAMAEAGIEVPASLKAAAMQEEAAPKRKKVVTTRKVKKVFDAKIATPPPGFRWVYNRLTQPFEEMFDGMVYRFDANEYRLLTDEVAMFLFHNSLISVDLAKRKGLRALALDPYHQSEERESEGFGEPMDDPKNVELLDRSTQANLTGESTGGLPTKPTMISVADVGRGSYLPRRS